MYDIVYSNKHCTVKEHTSQNTKNNNCITCCTKAEVAGTLMMLRNKYRGIKVNVVVKDI